MKDVDIFSSDGPGINVKTCTYCGHNLVCGVYDAFMDADVKVNDYSVLNPGYDKEVYAALANNCSCFTW